jgi:uncharacterized protein YjeT (DUF2065 family)
VSYFLSVLGLALVLEGLPYLAFPSQVKDVVRRLPEFSDAALRGVGLAAIAVGMTLLFLVR